jgi:hypothetical protein
VVPIFPELRPYLEAVWEAAEPGTEWLITRYRDVSQNLRTQMEKIIRRAGLKPWPKLFQNLRATRETELAETFPMHVVCEWIGNSAAIADRWALRAGGAKCGAAGARTGWQRAAIGWGRKHKKPGFAELCECMRHSVQVFSGR